MKKLYYINELVIDKQTQEVTNKNKGMSPNIVY